MQSQLSWEAIYDNGTSVKENDIGSTEQIDRDRLKQFRLYKADGSAVFIAFFNKDRKLIFRKRNYLNAAGEPIGIVYLVGWHENIKGVSVKSICYVYEDGHIEFDDARNDLQLVPCEEFHGND
jgi:hypothetical protein